MASSLRTRSPVRYPVATRANERGDLPSEIEEEEMAPLMVESGRPVAQQHEPPVDWVMTSLLFLFPALGGMLFG